MSSSEASAQDHGVRVPVPEPAALLPLVLVVVDKKEMSSSETSAQDHGVPLPVPVAEPQAPAAEAEAKRMTALAVRRARRRRLEIFLMNRMASSDDGENVWAKRARPASGTSSGSSGGSAKVAPEPQQGPAAAAAWPKSLSHGVHSVIGRRRRMEDAVAIAAPLACQERLHVVLAEELARLHLASGGGDDAGARWREAMLAAFARVDDEVAVVQIATKDSTTVKPHGSTAVVVVVEPRRIVVANCGDSRAVLCRGGAAVPLSTDHKDASIQTDTFEPDRPDELERIESAGGQIIYWQGPRVLGVLAMSRSIGDYFMKPSMSAEPEVTVTDRTDTDEFIILASDGLWDVMSNEFACKVARYCLSGRAAAKCPATVGGSSASDAAALLVEMAAARGSDDNISVVVVELRRLAWRKKQAASSQQNGRT
ncbi:orphans transcription factor [Panicum miliaceum]|uniref:protein-serine/threonine phosphatase n=1 Tax=Panicum miliaceum TaxID=4540 RepID=A0A3L6QYV8_PANMI|nr:orphans transcription factor [Panicum miliaceum]